MPAACSPGDQRTLNSYSNMKDRIREVMTHLGLSQQDFAAKLQMAPASISSIFNGRTNPTINHVMAIHNAFPQISEKWLLFGEGEMFSSTTPNPTPSSSPMSLIDDDEEADSLGGFFNQPAGGSPSPQGGVTMGLSVSSSPSGGTVRPTSAQRDHARESSRDGRREAVYEDVKKVDKPLRRVKEIRVFYDDNTYETFVPAVK